MTRRVIITLVACAVLAVGCAYYNGLYNANRLAGEARRAEREGRTGEARSLWSRAAIKAESVAARFPKSKYRDDALLLQGKALYAISACTRAVTPLALAADSSPDPAIWREARLTLARCRLEMFEPDSVADIVSPVVEADDSSGRAAALLLRGRARLALGYPVAALADLQASGHRAAPFPLAVALARMGRTREAADLLLTRLHDVPYDEVRWLATLDTIGEREPAPSSKLVPQLTARTDLTDRQRARLWLSDAKRWLAAGTTDSAAVRFRAVIAVAADSLEGRAAQAHLTVREVRRTTRVELIPALADTLRATMRQGGEPVRIAERYANVLRRAALALAADSSDLLLFLAAEEMRDSLGAAPLAAALFQEIARRAPGSAIAPKALLAAAMLLPDAADSLIAVVRERYPESVYTLALDGRAPDAYRVLEDSLLRIISEAGRRNDR